MLYQLFKKIINTKVGRSNYILATVGLAIAIVLILGSLFVKFNFKKLHGNKTQYLVITKIVTGSMMVSPNLSTFTEADIEKIKQTPFFDSVQGVKSSLFRCKLKVPMASLPFSTEMFFESVPDAYLDKMPSEWKWQQGDNTIQAIAPRFFVDMFNYGFAVGQELPQLSDTTVTQIPFDFYISNKDETKTAKFNGSIGALSSRFFSLLVPESFMDWANKNFGYVANKAPTSVIVKAKNPADESMHKWLKANGLKSDFGMSRYSHYSFIINIIDKFATILGIVLFGFVIIIFVLYLQLTIVNAKKELALLSSLGTSKTQLRKFLLYKTMPIHFILFIVIVSILAIIQYLMHINKQLQYKEINLPAMLPWQIGVVAILLLAIILAINIYTINKKVNFTAKEND
jgi:hypothetical protein